MQRSNYRLRLQRLSVVGHAQLPTNLKDFDLYLFNHNTITAVTATMTTRTMMPATMPMIHRLDEPAGDTGDVIQSLLRHCMAPCTDRVSVPSQTLFVCSAHRMTSSAMVPLSMLPDPTALAWKKTVVGSLGSQAHLPLVMWSWVMLQIQIYFKLNASCSVRTPILSGPRSLYYMWEDGLNYNVSLNNI